MEVCDTKRKRIEPMDHQQINPQEVAEGIDFGNAVAVKGPNDNLLTVTKNDVLDGTEKKELEAEMSHIFDNALEADVDTSKNDKLSQLRQLLEKNLKSPNSMNSAFRLTSNAPDADPKLNRPPWSDVGAVGGQGGNLSLNQRRRVSFNPLVVHETPAGGNNVQPSPGTRKRHFSFQPISPRQNSLPQSPNQSPFISPRSTPVPMLRSRHSSGSALPLHLLPQGPKNNFGSSSSDTSRAATFGSTSECSTPFISPHGTPIPFNRSRHNSAQGRLCRSRHSSGLGPYRGAYSMTFSPMALNNLNNPYSPQPSTPLTNPDECLPPGLQHLADQNQRSRHSSAESEPPMMRPILTSPGQDMMDMSAAKRQRHASAGQANAVLPINREDWFSYSGPAEDNKKLLGNMEPSSDAIDTLKHESTFDAQLMDDSSSYHGGGQLFSPPPPPPSAGKGVRKESSNMQDDLDITLDALKDCDNDFSKFVIETENGK